MIRCYLGLVGLFGLSLAVVGCSSSGGGPGGGGSGGGGGGGASFDPQTKDISLGCTNNTTDDVSILDWELTVAPEPIIGGECFTAALDGVAFFDETFLDAAQAIVPGGVRKAELVDLAATVLVRTGAAGPTVTLGPEPIPYTCAQDPDGIGGKPCDPANDLTPPSAACNSQGVCGNTDCLFSFGNPSSKDICGQFVEVPISTDCGCTAGSGLCVCDATDNFVPGDQNKLQTQCETNGFCVTGSLPLPLEEATGTYLADDSGEVLFGWDDKNTGAQICTSTTAPDGFPANACDGGAGTYALPAASFSDPTEPTGLRVVALFEVGVQCTMAVRAGEDTVDNDGKVDQSAPTPDQCTQQNVDDGVGCTLGEDLLIRFPIVPGTGGSGGDGDSCGSGGTGGIGGAGGTGGIGGAGGTGGDNECDGSKQCTDDTDCLGQGSTCVAGQCTPVVCDDDPNDCLDGGTCTPTTGQCDGAGNANEGDLCSIDGGNVCDDSGNCVECLDSENNGTNPNCDSSAMDCVLPSLCSSNVCQAREQAPDGTTCSNGVCDDQGQCQFQAIDYCSGTPGSGLPDDPNLCTKVIAVACTNSITDDVSILDWTLTADPGNILGGQAVTVDYDGIGAFDETFLDAAQSVVSGGVTKAALNSIAATVVPRTGLTGADATNGVLLGTPDESVAPFTCNQYTVCDADSTEVGEACLSDAQCTGGLCIPATCDPANDVPPPSPACDPLDGPTCGNTDCIFAFGNPSAADICRQFIEIPTTTTGCLCNGGADSGSDCIGSGNECDTDDLFVVGQNKLATQCDPLGYCVTGGLSLPLASATGSYTAAASGDVLIGWEDRFTRLGDSVVCTDLNPPSAAYPDNACDGDAGTWALPAPAVPGTATVPPPGIGLRVNAGGLGVGVDCLMGVTAGNDTVDNDGKLDQSAPTPDTCTQQNVDDGVECTLGEDLLIRFGIQEP